nr:hypothetical protein [Tanacetum cinerariifolium]
MHTRSSSNLPVECPPNPSTSNPKRRTRRRSKQPFILEESLVDTMADQRTMAEFLRAPTERYAEAIVFSPILAEQFELKHSLINMMTSDQFFGLEKNNPHDHIPDQDSLNSAAGGNLLERRTQDVLTIIQNKSKVRNSRNKSVVSQVKSSDANSNSSSKIAKLTHAANQQTSACLAAGGNTFPELRDNIQGYVAAAAVKYNQGNSVYRPPGMTNQIRPSGFAQPNVQNNQNRFSQPQGYNRGNNFSPEQSYQAPTQQNQVVPLSELEKVKRMNEANMKAMQTQINNVKNELRNEMKNSIQAFMSNQTNELKNMMASFFQMNTASTSGSRSLPSNTVANPKGELKAITTKSGIVLDGPSVPIPLPFINPEEDELVEETLMDQDLAEYTIKVPPPLIQKYKPPSQRNFVVHQKDPLHPNILYPSRILKQKQQEKDEVQIYKFWQMFKQLHINITLADALILIPKYQKMLKALISNKEKLQELANTPLNENCSAVILKKLPEKLEDPGKFLILCGFNELKCKALADLGASINLMPLYVWKKLGLPDLISTRMTLELANRAICTPAGIARDVFVPVGKFTFPADFVIMILHDGDERLTLNMRHDTSSYSNQPQKESINLINVFNDSSEDFLENLFSTNHQNGNPIFSSHLTSPKVKDDIFDPEGGNVLPEKLLDLDSTKDLHPPHHVNPLSSSTTSSSSSNQLLEEFADELALITFSLGNDDLYNLADLNNNLVESMPEMFTKEHALDYSSPLLYNEYDDDLFEVESNTENVYDDPFDSKGEKIKESKLLIDELDLPCDFRLPSEYDSFFSEDFSEVDTLPSTNNEDKIFKTGILIQENLFEVITHVALEKNEKKLAIYHASLILEDFDPPLYKLPFFKEVPMSKILLSFSSENKEKNFKLGIHTSEKVHSSLIPELSHQGYKVFKINQILKSLMKIFLFSYGKDTHILDVPCGDKLVSWSSKKQDCTSMSSAEAEYVSLSASIAISCNPVQHFRTKHIDVRYHFIKEKVEKGIVELFFVGTEYQLADLFTKALSEDRFKYIVRRLGMRCLTPEELEVLENESA